MRIFDETLTKAFEKYCCSNNVFLCVSKGKHYMAITDEHGLAGKKYLLPCECEGDVLYACETAAIAHLVGYHKVRPFLGEKSLAELMK